MEVLPEGMSLPSELQFKDSLLEPGKIGVWTRKQVNKGRLYGPFKGERKSCTEVANDTYSWQIVGPKGRRLFCIDASDPSKGNWMRYVKTAPNSELRNLHPVQHKKKIYYKVLETLSSDTELLCWYDGATDPELREPDLLPMPVLEKMELAEDVGCRVSRRVPSPLEMPPTGLEPPLISPAYPNSYRDTTPEATPHTTGSEGTPINTAIQAPDITSSAELMPEAAGSISEVPKVDKEPVTSTQIPGKETKLSSKKKKKKQKKPNDFKSVRKKEALKFHKGKVRKLPSSDKTKMKKEKEPHELVTDLYIIGPDCIVVQGDGEEKYRCKLCGKLCKYPVGLKIHLRSSHYYSNVQFKGIAKKPWARGITLKREREEREALDGISKEDAALGEPPAKTWASVDCSVVQSALEKLKDISDQGAEPRDPAEDVSGQHTQMDSLSETTGGSASIPEKEEVVDALNTSTEPIPPGSNSIMEFKDKKKTDSYSSKGLESCDKTVDTSSSETQSGKQHKPKVKDSFARRASQTIIALAELSISESSDSDSKKLKNEKIAAVTDLLGKEKGSPSGPVHSLGKKFTSHKASPKKTKSLSNILPKKFSCPLCHQAFAYQVWLDRHVKMHSNSSTGYSCTVCKLRFFSKKDLTAHEAVHEDEGKYQKCEPSDMQMVAASAETATLHRVDSANDRDVVGSGKVKENGNLARIVASLRRIQEGTPTTSASAQKAVKQKGTHKRRNRAFKGTGKTYICRMCAATFANPSNRSRHMRVIHGVVKRKKSRETKRGSEVTASSSEPSSTIESSSGSTLADSLGELSSDTLSKSPIRSPLPVDNSSTLTQVLTPFPIQNTSHKGNLSPEKTPTKHRTSPKTKTTVLKGPKKVSPKKGSPKKGSSSKKIDVPVLFGYWKNMPRLKIVENHVKAHVRKQSKRKSIAPIDIIPEFPRTPDIVSPWDRVNKPAPFVPRTRNVHSLGSLVLHGEQPTDLSQKNSAAKLPQTKVDETVNTSVVGSEKTEMPQIRIFHPVDLSNGDDLQCKQESSGSGESGRLFNDPKKINTSDHHTPRKSFELSTPPARQERPKVSITSEVSSKMSPKTDPPVNPVEWHFTCNICGCHFVSIRELSRHVVAHAEDYPYKCEFCMHVFTLVDELRDHKESRHSVKTMYSCSVCKKEFAYLSNLENHQVEAHPGVRCTFEDDCSNVVRPQNFTDPTKGFNLRSQPPATAVRVSSLKEEMDKLFPLKRRNSTQEKDKTKPSVSTPKKTTPEKGLLFNPQRNHPFEQGRRIGYLSMLSDPRNQKQLGSKVNNVCTKCLLEFKETSAFHVHIMECASVKGDMMVRKGSTDKAGTTDKPGTNSSVAAPETDHKLRKLKNGTGKVSKKNISRRGRVTGRQKPGCVAYDPQKYLRAKMVVKSASDDTHSCAGCGKKFYFINQLERHMKMCPNREKLVNASKSTVALALRKRPRANTLQHRCTNCEKHFTYLGSLEKHLLMCTRKDASSSATTEDTTAVLSTAQSENYATDQKSLPDIVPADKADELSSEIGRQRRKRNMPHWRLQKNSL